MAYLVDTNVLLRIRHRPAPEHLLVRQALFRLHSQKQALYYASQNLVEFWCVCTRPSVARGGFGLSITETETRVRSLERFLQFLPDGPAVHAEWRRLVFQHSVSGVQVHDARLVASMLVHGVPNLLTLNVPDFRRYPGIVAVHPSSIR